MKRLYFILIFIVICVFSLLANEKSQEFNFLLNNNSKIFFTKLMNSENQTVVNCLDEINQNEDIDYLVKRLDHSLNHIFLGSTFLGVATAALGVVFSLIPFQIGPIVTLSIQIICGVVGLGLVGAGASLIAIGCRNYQKRHLLLDNNNLSSYYMKKSKNFLKIAIPNIAISGVSFLTVMAGVAMHITAYFNPSPLMYYGIIPDVIGGIGLAVCLPMMIASLAMSAWCKGQLAKLTPELTLAHDSKKDITEGYSVRMGLRVRI